MRRFRSVKSGVIVTVDDARAEAMGPGYEPFEAKGEIKAKPLTAAQKKAAAKGATAAEEAEAARLATEAEEAKAAAAAAAAAETAENK